MGVLTPEQARSHIIKLLTAMSQAGGSDLFISKDFPPSMKAQGMMKPLTSQKLSGEVTRDLAEALMNPRQKDEFSRELECNFAISVPGVSRFRVNIFVQQQNVGMVIRTIANEIPDMAKLGLPDTLKEIVMAKRGLVLVVGMAPKQFVDPFGRDSTIAKLAPFFSGQVSYAEALKREALPLGYHARFEGTLPNSSLTAAYARAGIFVFPSVWHEPFGIPLIEAMAAGLPVITTRGGASSEIVVDGETGILVERGDAHSLATAIRTLLSDAALRARMGAAGRERVARLFTWDRAVSRLSGLYDSVRGASPKRTDPARAVAA